MVVRPEKLTLELLMDPFFLHRIVSANAEIASAIDELDTDDPNYKGKHDMLVDISKRLETMITHEVVVQR